MSEKGVERSIGRLEGKIDSLIADVIRLRKASEHELHDLETRVAKLERKQYIIVGLTSIAWAGILVFLKKFF